MVVNLGQELTVVPLVTAPQAATDPSRRRGLGPLGEAPDLALALPEGNEVDLLPVGGHHARRRRRSKRSVAGGGERFRLNKERFPLSSAPYKGANRCNEAHS
jgi:hypothetical protein